MFKWEGELLLFPPGRVWLVSSLREPEFEVLMLWFSKYLEKENPPWVKWKQAGSVSCRAHHDLVSDPTGPCRSGCVELWVRPRAKVQQRVSPTAPRLLSISSARHESVFSFPKPGSGSFGVVFFTDIRKYHLSKPGTDKLSLLEIYLPAAPVLWELWSEI